MHDTQTQIDRLIELAIVQRTELKQLVEQLPELREHLNAEIEKVFDEVEPQLRVELEDWTAKQTADQTAKLGAALEAKINDLSKALEVSTQARYSAILAEREKNFALAAEAEAKIAEHAASLPEAVKGIVDAELARFPRAGEIDQLRKEFAEPKSLNPRGKWQAGVAYNKLDLVTLNGDSYTSAKDDNRTRPSRSSADWTLVAARGTGGGGGPTSLTDLTAVPQNGELLIGNGSAFVNNTLTAGTGVTITNGAGTITIDATGAQEILTATVKNAESVAITKGQVVYLFSATGGFPSVKLAYNTSDATSAKTFGVVSDTSIAPNGTGTVTCVGVVDGLNLGTYSDGDTVYLGATPGSFTATKPYAPNHLVYVGIIERANSGNGELYVRIQNGYELDEIHDVQINAPKLAGQTLIYDQTNNLWKNAQLTGTANQITVTNADAAVTLSIPTAVTNVNSLTAQSATNLTLEAGSSGASLVLLQGANGNASISPKGTGQFQINTTHDGTSLRTGLEIIGAMNSGGTGPTLAWYGIGLQQLARIYPTRTGGSFATTLQLQTAQAGGTLATFLTGNADQSATFSGNLTVSGTDIKINNSTGYLYVDGGSSLTGVVLSRSSNIVALYTANTERLRVNSSGNFLVGTTTDNGQKLQVAGTASITGNTTIGANATNAPTLIVNGTANSDRVVKWQAAGSDKWQLYSKATTDSFNLYSIGGTNTDVLTIAYSTGNVALTSTTASSSTTTGALVVSGGVGVAGAGYFGGNLTVSGGSVSGSTILDLSINQNPIWRVNASGHFIAIGGDNSFDIGLSGATRPRDLFLGRNATIGGNLTVSGTGASTVNGNLLITGTTNYTRIRRDDTIIDFTNAAQSAYANAQIIANNLHLKGNNGTGIYVNSSGNGLFGTTTDSGNGRIQLATHTTSAGGIGFGTETSLYRAAAGSLVLDHIGASSPTLNLSANGSIQARFFFNGSNTFLETYTSQSLILRTNQTTALTLDSSQNATFAGNAYIGKTGDVAGMGDYSGDSYVRIAAKSTNIGGIKFRPTVSDTNAYGFTLQYDGTNSKLAILRHEFSTAGTEALSIARATGNATFAGAIAIGNTVNTVSPTSPNRTITMVIGGTTYYIHAKTTND